MASKKRIFLLPPFLLVVLLGILPSRPTRAASHCEFQCQEAFKNDDLNHGHDSCERGCRLFFVLDGAVSKLDKSSQSTDHIDESALINCKHACEDSFEKEKDQKESKISACQSGCQFQLPENLNRRNLANKMEQEDPFNTNGLFPFSLNLLNVDNVFNDIFNRLGTSSEKSFWPQDFHNVFQNVRQQMQPMMSWMRDTMPRLEDLGGFGSGKIVVIESGPGYHKKQTFNIGPQTDTKQMLVKDDMMMKPNPLDKSMNLKDVEVMEDTTEASNEDSRVFDVEVLGPFQADFSALNFKPMEVPKLPEEGLRSRIQDTTLVYYDHSCQEDPTKMSWSDYLSCIHQKMKTPRWLTLACICLSVIFIIWICFVIPRSAPKQRIVICPMAKTKEAEANISIIVEKKSDLASIDLPPSYNEITKLKVNLDPTNEGADKKNAPEEGEEKKMDGKV